MEVLPRTLTQALANLTEADALARMAEVAQAVSISTIIDTYQLDEERTYETIEQLTRYGADGTASVGEFVALEVGAALGISPGSAIGRIADVLNVRDRYPVLWEAMLAGTVRFHQACRVASECVGLSADAVTQVDRQCAQALGQWPWARVLKELPSWIIAADPATATAKEVRARKERKVHITEIKDGQIEAFLRLKTPSPSGNWSSPSTPPRSLPQTTTAPTSPARHASTAGAPCWPTACPNCSAAPR